MMKAVLRITPCVLGALVLLGAGCVQRRVVYVTRPAPVPANETTVAASRTPVPAGETAAAESAATPADGSGITEAPPPPQVEVVGAAPSPDYVWMPGVWEWHKAWIWVSGRWVIRPRPEAIWIPGHWTSHRRGYVWIHGYWR